MSVLKDGDENAKDQRGKRMAGKGGKGLYERKIKILLMN